jgi:hypothetical protein
MIRQETISTRVSEEQRLVLQLTSSLRRDGWSPGGALKMLAAVIKQKAWDAVGFPDLHAMLVAPAPQGVGMSDDEIGRLLGFRHPDEHASARRRREMDRVRFELQRAITPEATQNGGDRRSDEFQRDIVPLNQRGNSRRDTLRRLRRDRPDLAERVDAGELSAHSAAIEAGFRKPTATVKVDTPANALRALTSRFTVDELRTALDELVDELQGARE